MSTIGVVPDHAPRDLADLVPGAGIWIAGAVIVAGRQAFVQRRAPQHEVLPGAWDIVGGHVIPGETMRAALQREITEETGWYLDAVLGVLDTSTWEGAGETRHEIDFAVTVTGDLTQPALELDRHTESRWVTSNDLATGILAEGRAADDHWLYTIVSSALTIDGGLL